MQCLDVLGFSDCYYLDNNRVFNIKRNKYVNEIGEYRYRLRTKNGKAKSITLKEIYKKLFDKVFCIDEIQRLEGEVFKEIVGTEGNYLVSNCGRIISYVANHAIVLKPTVTPNGYERLQIRINGHKFNKFVHSLVAEAWLGQPKSLEQEIHHKDFNRRNNNYRNLQYVYKDEHIKLHSERKE